MSSKNQSLNLDKDVLYDLYLNQQMTTNEIGKIFDCTSACVRKYLSKYNITIRQNGEAVKLERSKWPKEKEKARSKKFIQNWADKSEEERREINVRKTAGWHTSEAVQKQINSRIANGTSKESKAELEFMNKLSLFLDKDDLIHHYTDLKRYPFDCDFYIPSKDLFIEYQGHQTHGYEPYSPQNPEHWVYSDYLETHGFSSSIFTIRDPNKLKVAKQNKINLLLIYPKNNSYLVTNGVLINIGKFDVTKINDLC